MDTKYTKAVFKSMCRCCKAVTTPESQTVWQPHYFKLYTRITLLELTFSDKLPMVLCRECGSKFDAMGDFISQCLETHCDLISIADKISADVEQEAPLDIKPDDLFESEINHPDETTEFVKVKEEFMDVEPNEPFYIQTPCKMCGIIRTIELSDRNMIAQTMLTSCNICAKTSGIDDLIDASARGNTIKAQKSIWNQFQCFCRQKQYELLKETPVKEINNILRDWAFNMRKANGDDYKVSVVKTMFNVTAKLIQKMYRKRYNIKFDPFKDEEFKTARNAKNVYRKELKTIPEKRKQSWISLNRDEVRMIAKSFNENTPPGLQRKFYQLASYELGWKSSEAGNCHLDDFKQEILPDGSPTGRICYTPRITRPNQTKAKVKWLTEDKIEEDMCPVRLLKKMISKRTDNITTPRLFLTPNTFWQRDTSGWYKNLPVGKNEISKWTRQAVKNIGLDLTKKN